MALAAAVPTQETHHSMRSAIIAGLMMLAQLLELLGVLQERQRPVADQVDRGLMHRANLGNTPAQAAFP
jgi:hypothetical protein